MSSILEKITLYDILGYMIPGVVFLSLSCSVKFSSLTFEQMEIYKDYRNVFLFIFLICGYISGIVISEISRFAFEKIWLKLVSKISGMYVTTRGWQEEFEVSVLKQALENSKLMEDIPQEGIFSKSFHVMYSDIQTDEKFKRIHNYASAEVMYKNLSIAFLMGGILCYLEIKAIYGCIVLEVLIGSIIVASILGARYCRFREKKYKYTIRCFIQKYMGR